MQEYFLGTPLTCESIFITTSAGICVLYTNSGAICCGYKRMWERTNDKRNRLGRRSGQRVGKHFLLAVVLSYSSLMLPATGRRQTRRAGAKGAASEVKISSATMPPMVERGSCQATPQ